MKIRHPIFTATGAIDVEAHHPRFGWIPFTASAEDPEASGREIYARALAGEAGPIAAYVPPPEPPEEPAEEPQQ